MIGARTHSTHVILWLQESQVSDCLVQVWATLVQHSVWDVHVFFSVFVVHLKLYLVWGGSSVTVSSILFLSEAKWLPKALQHRGTAGRMFCAQLCCATFGLLLFGFTILCKCNSEPLYESEDVLKILCVMFSFNAFVFGNNSGCVAVFMRARTYTRMLDLCVFF